MCTGPLTTTKDGVRRSNSRHPTYFYITGRCSETDCCNYRMNRALTELSPLKVQVWDAKGECCGLLAHSGAEDPGFGCAQGAGVLPSKRPGSPILSGAAELDKLFLVHRRQVPSSRSRFGMRGASVLPFWCTSAQVGEGQGLGCDGRQSCPVRITR